MKIILLLLSILLMSDITEARKKKKKLIDVLWLAGKTKEQISKGIGKPLECAKGKHGEVCSFEKAETEITFVKGKADWIIIEQIDNMIFQQETIKEVGLYPSKPTMENRYIMQWENRQGLLKFTLIRGFDNSADYIEIEAKTPRKD